MLCSQQSGEITIKLAPNETYVRSTALFGFSEIVERLGGNPADILRECGLDPIVLKRDDMYYSFRRGAMSLEIAANTLNRPSFGLEYAQSLPDQFHNLGPIVFTAYFEDTLRDWFNAAMSYINFHTNALSLQLIEDTGGGHGVLRIHMDSAAIPGR